MWSLEFTNLILHSKELRKEEKERKEKLLWSSQNQDFSTITEKKNESDVISKQELLDKF